MKRHWAHLLLALLTILILVAGAAAASDKDKDKDQGQDRDNHPQWRDSDERHWYVRHISDQDRDDHPHGNPQGDAHHDRDGDHDRDHWASSGYRQGTPPGWGHGQKKGWGNCGMPPGQAKKYGCSTYVYQGKQYEYFHDEAGQMRWRPHVSAHGSVDVHY